MSLTSRRGEVVRWTLTVATLVVAGIFLAPKTSDALRTARGLSTVEPGWIGLALTAELISLLAFSMVTYLLVERVRRPRLGRVIRADLVSIALSHAVPAGSAAGTVLGYRLLADEGAGSLQSGFAKVTQSLISVFLLQWVLWGALVLMVSFGSASAGYVVLAGIGVLVVLGILALAWLLIRHEPVIRRMAVSFFSRVPRLNETRVASTVDRLSKRLRRLAQRPGTLAAVSTWSLANWVFDGLALWASLRAFGYASGLIALTLAFTVAQIAGSLPISMGGLGIVEASLVPLLVGLGTGSSVAVLGVLTWRLFNYWLPLLMGGVAYLLIVAERRRNGGSVRPTLVADARSGREVGASR
jgi:uncharacterized protein (TIRG00374 family)